MQIEIWKIHGQSYHFGTQGLGQEVTRVCFPSDSLFSAMVSRLAALHGSSSVKDFMHSFESGEPPFLLSSTFPFAGEVLFFPVPLNSREYSSSQASSIPHKRLKQIQYVSKAIFRQLIGGASLENVVEKSLMLKNGSLAFNPAENTKLPHDLQAGGDVFAIIKRPRVAVGRSDNRSTIFHTGQVSFAPGCGLWFGLRWMTENPDLESLVSELLSDLGSSGLGAERSTGLGACSFLPAGRIELPDSKNQLQVILGRCLPAEDEIGLLQHPQAAYRIERVGGWLTSPKRSGQRRRVVNMLVEGSILGSHSRTFAGQLVDARPVYAADPDPVGHPVYRSGYSLCCGMRGGET